MSHLRRALTAVILVLSSWVLVLGMLTDKEYECGLCGRKYRALSEGWFSVRFEDQEGQEILPQQCSPNRYWCSDRCTALGLRTR